MKSTQKTIMSIFYLGLLLAMISIAFAYPVNINVNSLDGTFGTVLYECTSFPCTSLTGGRIANLFGNPNDYAIPDRGAGKKYFAEYDFQECTIPHTYVVDTDSSVSSGPWSFTIDFQKRQNCISHINYVLLSNNTPTIGQAIQVTTQVTSGLAYTNYVQVLPTELRDAYSTDVTVILYVDNVEISRKKVNAVISESVPVSFTYTPQTSGTHVVRISTLFDQECKCSGWEQQNIETTLFVPALPIICSNNLQCGSVTNLFTCSGLNNLSFRTIRTTPTCFNAGTSQSYCSNVTTTINSQQCNHLCSATQGCDYTQCSDNRDNDGDTKIDYPQDPGCLSYSDNDEYNAPIVCSNNLQCGSVSTSTECKILDFRTLSTTPTCMNAGTSQSYCINVTTVTNTDICDHICSATQGCDYTQCSDNRDNDGDTKIDYPQDPGCLSYFDNDEYNAPVICSNNLQCGSVTSVTSCNGLNFVTTRTTPTCINPSTTQSYCSNITTIINSQQCNHLCSATQGCDYTQCSDNRDNDGDTKIDYPQDPGCLSYSDNDEYNAPIVCSNNLQCGSVSTSTECKILDFRTLSTTPTCMNAGTSQSYCINVTTVTNTDICNHLCSVTQGCDYTQCSDNRDNDGDTKIDYPQDPGCLSYADNDEYNAPVICSNNLQCGSVTSVTSCNGLNFITTRTTPTCFNAGTSQSYCSNVTATTNSQQCNHLCSATQGCDYTQCSDSIDNDGDTFVDYPNDPGCLSYADNDEYNAPIVCSSNAQCGVSSTLSSCSGLNYITNTITPTCFNAGTQYSYCQNIQTPSTRICAHICSNSLGCDYTQCSDSLDNDHDAFIDYPADVGCTDYYDDNEYNPPVCNTNAQCGSVSSQGYCEANTYVIRFTTPTCLNAGTSSSYCTSVISYQRQNCNHICSNTLGCDYTQCSDSQDNDGDTFVDYPNDPGCLNYADNDEYNAPVIITCSSDSQCGTQSNSATCNNLVFGITVVTPKCMNAGTSQSYCTIITNTTNTICHKLCSPTAGCDYTQCSDSTDNDGDTFVDYPNDPGCLSYFDTDEYNQPPVVACYANSQCGIVSSSQICNGLNFVTTLKTPTCFEPGTASSYCFNVTTTTSNQQCAHICSNTQGCDYTQCSDSADNDDDSFIDYPRDIGCTDYFDNNEYNAPIVCTSNAQCGSVLTSTECKLLDFRTLTTTPTCMNAGTSQSYCINVTTVTNTDTCDHICSATYGCDYTQCSDGIDNADPEDTLVDYSQDPGCIDYYDNNETNLVIVCSSNLQCGVVTSSQSCIGLNNSIFRTTSTTPTCNNAGTPQSYCSNVTTIINSQQCTHICSNTLGCDYTQCSDSTDNDGDTFVDYPQDIGCVDYYDNDEYNAPIICSHNSQCGVVTSSQSCIGLNNSIFRTTSTTPTCNNAGTPQSYCSNVTTIINSQQCTHICSNTLGCDYTQCSDSTDNDGDNFIDYSQDIGCVDYYDNDEYNAPIICSHNSQCGVVTSSQSCNGLNFETTTTTPTCINPNTTQSYCQNVAAITNIQICSYQCSNIQGCINPPINCSSNAQCGVVSTSTSCSELNFITATTTPTCINAGTIQSYCAHVIGYTMQQCNYKCSPTLGCLVQPFEPKPIPKINYIDPDMAIERISLDMDQCITPGETLPIGIDFRNSGGASFSNVKIQVAIPELGISRSAGPFKLKLSDSGYRSLNLYIPANTPPGEHTVRITIIDGAAKRVQHRDIWVGDCPNWM